ncbi:hypothetical protein Cus16_2919 [Curtobacterium sp. ER1/6]|nr:hypothetical protein Cus16_2919 [Curtobacterium sp. ER1/6]
MPADPGAERVAEEGDVGEQVRVDDRRDVGDEQLHRVRRRFVRLRRRPVAALVERDDPVARADEVAGPPRGVPVEDRAGGEPVHGHHDGGIRVTEVVRRELQAVRGHHGTGTGRFGDE